MPVSGAVDASRWTLSPWFDLGLALVACALIVAAFRWRLARAARRSEELQRQVAERTRELAIATEKAEAANRAKSAFLANMSHELRTPLNSMLGYAQLLQLERGLSDRQVAGLATIRESGEHLLALINDILDLSRVEAGKLDLRMADLDLPGFLRGVADIMRVRMEQKRLAFVIEFSASLPATLRADETRLRQVLLNLLGNAVKFTERGSVRFCVEEAMTGSGGAPAGVRFVVEDTGVGMSPAQAERLFRPFERLSEGDDPAESGAGLGLAISRDLIQLMGGAIGVESSPGRGSRFHFTLNGAAGADRQSRACYAGPARRVLVVDDVASNRTALTHVLVEMGFQVAEASDGEVALAEAMRSRPDLALIDVMMPRMTGLETARRLHAIDGLETVPVVALSAAAGDRDDATRAGAKRFLAKPVDPSALRAALAELLDLDWIAPKSEDRGAGPEIALKESVLFAAVPSAILETLLGHARRGDMRAMREAAERLQRLGEQHRPLAARLRELADDCRSRALVQTVQLLVPEEGRS